MGRDLVQYKESIDYAISNLDINTSMLTVMKVYAALGVRSVFPPSAVVPTEEMLGPELYIFLDGQERLFDYFSKCGVFKIPLSSHLSKRWLHFDTWRDVVSRTSHLHFVAAILLRALPHPLPSSPQIIDGAGSIQILSLWTGDTLKSVPSDDRRTQILRTCEHLFGTPWTILVGSSIDDVDAILVEIAQGQPPFLPGLALQHKTPLLFELPHFELHSI
jgi:hypothetical protein